MSQAASCSKSERFFLLAAAVLRFPVPGGPCAELLPRTTLLKRQSTIRKKNEERKRKERKKEKKKKKKRSQTSDLARRNILVCQGSIRGSGTVQKGGES